MACAAITRPRWRCRDGTAASLKASNAVRSFGKKSTRAYHQGGQNVNLEALTIGGGYPIAPDLLGSALASGDSLST
jgi:hypothetical protein